jgi:hypothetical protein
MPLNINSQIINNYKAKQYEFNSIVKDELVLHLDPSMIGITGGTTLYDYSGMGNNATLINGPSYNSSLGGYFTTDGVDDYISAPIPSLFNNVSISVWYKYTANRPRLLHGLSSASELISTISNSGSNTSWKVTKYGVVDIYIGTIPAINSWHNVTVTYSSSNGVKVYNNGSLSGSSGNTSNFRLSGLGLLYIGGNTEYGYNTGDLGQVLVYSKELSSTEITQNYNAMKGRFGL